MIEEPPPRSLFLIVANRPGQVLPTIRSRCRRLALEPLGVADIVRVVGGLGEPWAETARETLAREAARAQGSVRATLERIDPAVAETGALIEAVVARLPEIDFRQVHRLADVVAARGAGAAFDTLMNALYDWLAERARGGGQAARLASIADIWDKIRAATREAEAYNIDRKLHVLSVFADLSAAARLL
jgi:DNA polymerase-3 subunit delta'